MRVADGEFVRVATTDILTSDGTHACTAGTQQILLCRSQGQWYALSPWCTHAGATLNGARVCSGVIECPWHGATFDVANGAALSPPATRSLRTFPVRILDKDIEVGLPLSMRPPA